MFDWFRQFFAVRTPAPSLRASLEKQARYGESDARREAVEALADVSEPWAIQTLVDLLGDSHTVIRVAARAALQKLGVTAVPTLFKGLERGSDAVAAAAAELLGEMQVAEAVRPLLLALKFGPRGGQLAARRALVRLGSWSLPELEAARIDPEPWVRQHIEEALAEIQARSEPS